LRANNLRPENLPLLQLLGPLLFVIGGIYVLGPTLPMTRRWARGLVFAAVWLIIARYIGWRLFTTVMPAHGAWHEVGWVWFCFAVEILALFDALMLYITFLRSGDRRAEADGHEARLRALSPDQFPSVDVYIPTYNESFDVLEKTITGALCLDYPNVRLWVLDDGRRPWLKAFCEAKGIGYLTRPDNAHAKAGNINHALTKTDGDFVAVFDADFVPQRNFLMRTIGFFDDPRIGIVQVPHVFYNHDPMQANLALRKSMPDDQRFFFEGIMPSRDAWDAAFCCGSNSVTRRTALRRIGDALPTTSITEDMLLSLALLRNGYITRYLCERLAYGLAPETLRAFFVQRQRWARGAMQILFQAVGPLGRNLTLMQRLLFLPTHWLSQSLMLLMTVVAPIVFMWTNTRPLVNVTAEGIVYYLLPMVLSVVGGILAYAPRRYFPIAAQVLGVFQSFKILPTVLATIVKPHGHVFKVTPKGAAAQDSNNDRSVFWIAAILMMLTTGGLLVNATPEWRIVSQAGLVPIVAMWSGLNVVILLLVCMLSLQAPIRRAEERFDLDEPVGIFAANGALSTGRAKDMSLSGVGIKVDSTRAFTASVGEQVRVFVPEVGFLEGLAVRKSDDFLGVQFNLRPSIERDLLIRKLFTGAVANASVDISVIAATGMLLKSIWSAPTASAQITPEMTAMPVIERLPAVSLVIPPRAPAIRLEKIVADRRAMAA
jgi:cellulose synthase/poly-beta-1,6-N-acetylglucosamine synthase-like glycosyltransferase